QPNFESPPSVGALSPDGRTLALAVFASPTVVLIDTATGKETRQLNDNESWATQLAFTPDGRTLAVFSDDRSVHLWDPARGIKLRQLLPPGTTPRRGNIGLSGQDATAFSPDGKLIAYVKPDGSPALFELATGKPISFSQTSAKGVSVFAFSPDGRILAWSGY